MKIRPELRYRPASPSQVEKLRQALSQVESAIDLGRDPAPEVARFNALSGSNRSEHELANYWRSTDVETFLDEAAQAPPRRVPDIRREELVEMVELIISAETEAEQGYYVRLFDAQVAMPNASMQIFHAPPGHAPSDWDPTPTEVVEIVLAYRPIEL